MHDAQGFRHRLATRQRRATPTANVLALAQRLDHAELQRSSRIGVNRGVNRLVADAAVGIVGMHHAQSGRNLLRRPTVIHQSVVNVLEQRRAFLQAPPTTTAQTTAAIGLRRRRGVVAAARVRRRRRNVVTRELAADARCIPSQSSGHRTHAPLQRSIMITARSSTLKCRYCLSIATPYVRVLHLKAEPHTPPHGRRRRAVDRHDPPRYLFTLGAERGRTLRAHGARTVGARIAPCARPRPVSRDDTVHVRPDRHGVPRLTSRRGSKAARASRDVGREYADACDRDSERHWSRRVTHRTRLCGPVGAWRWRRVSLTYGSVSNGAEMTPRAREASLQTYAPIAGRRSQGIGVGGSIARPIVREKTFHHSARPSNWYLSEWKAADAFV